MQSNNYIYFVIQDNEQKIRAHIIGTQHKVDYKDQNLNPAIINAITRSSRAVLEMPPGSTLLPSSQPQWIPNPEWIIDQEIKQIKLNEKPDRDATIELKVTAVMKEIEEHTPKENFQKVFKALETIPSSNDRLNFVEGILRNIAEFNEVTLEEHINRLVKANENCKIEPLEDIDLGAMINEALKKEEDAKLKNKDKTPPLINENIERLRQKIKEVLYKAWAKGDIEYLSQLLDASFLLYPDPPELVKVQGSRDAKIANKIIEVVLRDNKESTIVLGCAHLLYTKRKNVLEYLNESFTSDLSGWSIKQIKTQL